MPATMVAATAFWIGAIGVALVGRLMPGVLFPAEGLWLLATPIAVLVLGKAALILAWFAPIRVAPKQVFASAVAGTLLVSGLVYRTELREEFPRVAGQMTARLTGEASGSGSMSVRRGHDGHFWVDTTINGRYVRFMVDTGATMVALTRKDARRIGIPVRELEFKHKASTPNGPLAYARIRLDNIRVGTLGAKNVMAAVFDMEDGISLLGMTFLNTLESVDVRGGIMILRQ